MSPTGSSGETNDTNDRRERGPLTREELAAMVAADIPHGAYVNLGIGQPTAVADHLLPEQRVVLHTENGMLGMGRAATASEVDPELINAGKVPVIEAAGASYFHSADSFAMMRGGHLDICVLGAFQVSAEGDLANWNTGDAAAMPAVGGAMDLAIGARQVFVMMNLFGRDGSPKLVAQCSYPLTAVACVTQLYTDFGRFSFDGHGVHLVASYGASHQELVSRTGLDLLGPE